MRRVRRLVILTIGCTLIGSPLSAQTLARHPRVSQALNLVSVWLDAERAYGEIPGVSASVVHDQDVLWTGGFGYADPERRIAATPSTVYSICSISKLFTSIALMQLRDTGKLRLDDPVAQHLPWFTIKRTFPDAPEITVEGLLTHSSGLPREAEFPYWVGPDFRFPKQQEIVEALKAQETLYPAATNFQYSNLGLTLAGEIVAAESRQPFAEYVQRNILQPLGLTSTSPEMPEQLQGTRLARGYSAMTRDGTRKPLPFFQTRGVAPAAGFASTAEDPARFAMWQFRLLGKGSNEVLNANTLREMQRVHWVDPDFETTRGLGFAVWRAGDKTLVGHGGSCPGYRAMLTLQPAERIGTVFLANASGVDVGQIAQRMYEIVSPSITAAAKDSSKTVSQPDTSLLKYVGNYDIGPWGGETAVLPWEDGLAMLSLPTSEPMKNLVKIRRVPGEHTFRRVRKDGSLGEVIRFEVGPDGRAVRYWQHSNPWPRINAAVPVQRASRRSGSHGWVG